MASSSSTALPEDSFLRPRVFLPFLAVAMIWGSTWLVIRDQVSSVPPGWSVTYRFLLAATGMFVLAAIMRAPLIIDRRGHALAMIMGLLQFVGNFNFVYRAEQYVTSGLVAVLFGLLILPNALLGRLWLKAPISGRFLLGTAIAMAGVVALMLDEYEAAAALGKGSGTAMLTGIGFVLLAILSVSVANVMQATRAVGRYPLVPMIAWSMAWGALFDAILAYALSGPPVIEARWSYLGGIAYLAILGSVVTFPLYYRLIRTIGPGKAAYNSVLTPIIAMALSTVFEGFEWSLRAVIGGVLALIGLIIALTSRAKAAEPQ